MRAAADAAVAAGGAAAAVVRVVQNVDLAPVGREVVAVRPAVVAFVSAHAARARRLGVGIRRADVVARAAVIGVVLQVAAVWRAGTVGQRARAPALLLDAVRVDRMAHLAGLAREAARTAIRRASPAERLAAVAGVGRLEHVAVAVEPEVTRLLHAHPRAIRQSAVGVRPVASVALVEGNERWVLRALPPAHAAVHRIGVEVLALLATLGNAVAVDGAERTSAGAHVAHLVAGAGVVLGAHDAATAAVVRVAHEVDAAAVTLLVELSDAREGRAVPVAPTIVAEGDRVVRERPAIGPRVGAHVAASTTVRDARIEVRFAAVRRVVVAVGPMWGARVVRADARGFRLEAAIGGEQRIRARVDRRVGELVVRRAARLEHARGPESHCDARAREDQ